MPCVWCGSTVIAVGVLWLQRAQVRCVGFDLCKASKLRGARILERHVRVSTAVETKQKNCACMCRCIPTKSNRKSDTIILASCSKNGASFISKGIRDLQQKIGSVAPSLLALPVYPPPPHPSSPCLNSRVVSSFRFSLADWVGRTFAITPAWCL